MKYNKTMLTKMIMPLAQEILPEKEKKPSKNNGSLINRYNYVNFKICDFNILWRNVDLPLGNNLVSFLKYLRAFLFPNN